MQTLIFHFKRTFLVERIIIISLFCLIEFVKLKNKLFTKIYFLQKLNYIFLNFRLEELFALILKRENKIFY